ncbi:MAG: hypothetical protein K1X35_09910 [Caulobacteraceae bacterium]|nr:hypothetical protein [Caulobacteraceae bacterium]
MPDLAAEWRRCAPWLAPALDGTHALEDVWAGVARGEFHFWPGLRSAAVGELVEHPRRRDYHVWLAGGDLGELKTMEASASAFARALGCHRITIHGRPGWARALPDYRPAYLALAKDLTMSSKSKTKTRNTQTLSPWAQQQYETLSQGILGLAHQPVTPYGGSLSAGPDALQQAAQALAGASIGAGSGVTSAAIDAARAAAGYAPMAADGGSLNGMDLSGYMNPYTDAVIGGFLDDIERSRARAVNEQAGEFTRQGAWGGSRHGVADALTNDVYARQAREGIESIRSTAYQNAQSQAAQDFLRQMQAQIANQSAGLQGAQLGLSAATLMGALGLQQQQMGMADANLLNQFGTQNQAYAQQGLDAAYQEFLRQQQHPFQQAGLMQGVLGATPWPMNSTGVNLTTGYDPMGWAQVAAGLYDSSRK